MYFLPQIQYAHLSSHTLDSLHYWPCFLDFHDSFEWQAAMLRSERAWQQGGWISHYSAGGFWVWLSQLFFTVADLARFQSLLCRREGGELLPYGRKVLVVGEWCCGVNVLLLFLLPHAGLSAHLQVRGPRCVRLLGGRLD